MVAMLNTRSFDFLWRAQIKVKTLFPGQRLRDTGWLPADTRKKEIFITHLLNVVFTACLAMYLFITFLTEVTLVIGGILTAFLLIFEFGKVPVL